MGVMTAFSNFKKLKKFYLVAKSQDPKILVANAFERTKIWLHPSEGQLAVAPVLSGWILKKLVFSIVLDSIGFIFTILPILGPIFNLFWAPISSVVVHSFYNTGFFTILSFVEQMIPVLSFFPTATVAWTYTYFDFFPVWWIRFYRGNFSKEWQENINGVEQSIEMKAEQAKDSILKKNEETNVSEMHLRRRTMPVDCTNEFVKEAN